METVDYILAILIYISTAIWIGVSINNIKHIYAVKDSTGISLPSLYISIFSLSILTVYGIYYQLIALLISYITQLLLLVIYTILVKRYETRLITDN